MSRSHSPARRSVPWSVVALAALIVLPVLPAPAPAQESSQAWLDRCAQGRMNSERVTHCELREATIAAPSLLDVDAAPNGGIEVQGGNRSDVHVVGRVQSWAESEAEARELASQVGLETAGGRLRATGPRIRGERNVGWSVTWVISAPARLDLELSTVNGGIDVANVAGDLSLGTTNGGIRLEEVGGSVDARTTNGGIEVELAGDRWAGEGLRLQTTNGSIAVAVPDDFAADLTASTVHGGIQTDFPVTVRGRIGRSVDAQLGGGGPPVRLATTNGGIELRRR